MISSVVRPVKSSRLGAATSRPSKENSTSAHGILPKLELTNERTFGNRKIENSSVKASS